MTAIFIGLSVAIALFIAHEAGARVGQRAALREEKSGSELGAVSGALLGLLGLLLAFSFSSASQRFIDRQDLIVREANALGTAWLRAGAFPAPQREALRASLAAYADSRVTLGRVAADMDAVAEAENASAALHPALWAAGLEAVAVSPGQTMLLLPALNDVIDLHSLRAAASRRHHPEAVLVLLGLASLAATAILGYSSGLAGRRHPWVQAAFALLVAGILWLIVDLDYPRAGLIRLDQAPLKEARAAMAP